MTAAANHGPRKTNSIYKNKVQLSRKIVRAYYRGTKERNENSVRKLAICEPQG